MTEIEDVAWTAIYLPLIMIVLTLIIFVFAFFIAGHRDRLTAVPAELKGELISLRFTNNQNCFAYQDSLTKRIYPGIIDLSKFTEDQLHRCYNTNLETGGQDFNFRLQLGDKEIKTNNYFFIDHFTIEKKVLVQENNQRKEATLNIFVQARGRR